MYVIPMCITVYKIIAPIFSPSLHTLAIEPFVRSNNSEGIRLKVTGQTMIKSFEYLLQMNNYEMIDKSDYRMITWCDIESKGGIIPNYDRKSMKFKTSDGRWVKANEELNEFIQKYETNSFKQAMEVVSMARTKRCYKEIIAANDKVRKLSELQDRICHPDMIASMMEVGWLRAEGEFSSVTSQSNQALHSVEFDVPLKLVNYVDFNGFMKLGNYIRLIGYQGELRVLESKGINYNGYEPCNKFGEIIPNECLVSEFRFLSLINNQVNSYRQLKNNYFVKNHPQKGKILRLGVFNK